MRGDKKGYAKVAADAQELGMTVDQYIEWALNTNEENTIRGAAKLVGVSPEWFYDRLENLGLRVKKFYRIEESIEQEQPQC